MNEKEITRMIEVSAVLFKNNVPVKEGKIIGNFITKLQQKNKSLHGDIKFHAEKSKNRYNEIMNLKRKITKLENQLQRAVNDCKQRDEVIEKAYKLLKIFQSEFDVTDDVYKEVEFILDILKK